MKTEHQRARAVSDRIGPGDPRYSALVGRGFNKRFAGKPDYVRLVHSTGEVIDAVQDAVKEGRRAISSCRSLSHEVYRMQQHRHVVDAQSHQVHGEQCPSERASRGPRGGGRLLAHTSRTRNTTCDSTAGQRGGIWFSASVFNETMGGSRTEFATTQVRHDFAKRIWHPRRRINFDDATFEHSAFAGKDGIGHNVPQEARKTFAEAIVDVWQLFIG